MTDEEREVAKVTGFIKVTSAPDGKTHWLRASSITSIIVHDDGYRVCGAEEPWFKCIENPLELIADLSVELEASDARS